MGSGEGNSNNAWVPKTSRSATTSTVFPELMHHRKVQKILESKSTPCAMKWVAEGLRDSFKGAKERVNQVKYRSTGVI